jgi:signal transduction histidine kinase
LGNLEKALLYKNKYMELNDSLLDEQTRNHVLDLEASYQTARKDKMLAEQDLALERSAEMLRRRNAWLWAAGGGLVIVLLALALSWQRQRMLRLRAVMEGQDQERQRIAKEIHDDIGTGLTSILYLSDGLKEEEEQAVGKIGNTARELIDKMDEIVWSMNKDYDTLEDLLAFLRHHIAEWMDVPGIDTHIDFPDEVPALTITGEQRRNIYLVVKEALHNVIGHAEATTVNIKAAIHRGLEIEIRDNGKGLPEGPTRRWGNGLKNMRQRMEHLGGKFELTGGDGAGRGGGSGAGGTKVRVFLPLK